jgi:hypothetical protein
MTFVGGFIDEADSVLFNNVSVIEVPEMSAASLLGLGGCVWLLAPPWRRSFQNRKRN